MCSTPFIGICRGMLSWSDLTGQGYIAVGTTQRLEVLTNGVLSDITPITLTSNLLNPFTTTAGSPVVTVLDPADQVFVGDWIYIETAAYIDGLFLQGLYQVTSVIAGGYEFNAGANAVAGVANGGATFAFTLTAGSHVIGLTMGGFTFTNQQSITVFVPTILGGITISGNYVVSVAGPSASISTLLAPTGNATGSENGGNVSIGYLLASSVEPTGPVAMTDDAGNILYDDAGNPLFSGPAQSPGSGAFGSGSFGAGPFGVGTGTAPLGGFQRQWSMDAWGEDLLAGVVSGPTFTWTPPVATGNVATLLTGAPAQMTGFFVVQPVQQVMGYGCTDPNTGEQDPLLVRFSDVGDNTDWIASATNQAGSFRLSSGNQCVGGLAIGGQALIWTDIDLWVAQYLGFPLVWGFNKIARSSGLLCRRGAVALNNRVFWVSFNNFYQFDGSSVQAMPCSVWDVVFNNIDKTNIGSAFMGGDAPFSEFFFFYPTVGSGGNVSNYAKFNYQSSAWDYGATASLVRSAWSDQNPFGQPSATDYNGLIQAQEQGPALDGVAMDSYAISGWQSLGGGVESQHMKWFWPDFILSGGSVLVTLYFTDYVDVDANNPVRTYGPYTFSGSTPYVYVNGRGRFWAIKVESTALGVFWRLGKCRAVITPDGKGP